MNYLPNLLPETNNSPHPISKALVYRSEWHLGELFKNLKSEEILLSAEAKRLSEDLFWHNVCTEYDAQNFFDHLVQTSGDWSTNFIELVFYWLRDEKKHTEGFAKIYSLVYGESMESIYLRLAKRRVNFEHLQEFFADEYKLCLLLAYDELVTTHVYDEATAFFDKLSQDQLGQFIRQLKADEALHFGNLIRHMNQYHSHRAPEALEILETIRKMGNLGEYQGTFVLDYERDDFALTEDELKSKIINVIAKKLNRSSDSVSDDSTTRLF